MKHLVNLFMINVIFMFFVNIPAHAGEARGEGNVEQFVDAVLPSFNELREAVRDYVDSQGAEPEDSRAGMERYSRANERFADAVNNNWRLVSSRVDKSGEEAFKAAQDFETEMYHTLRVSREEAVGRYFEVARRFPNTLVHDQALFMASVLYSQRALGEEQVDVDKAAAIWKRLAESSGAYSPYVVMAQFDLSGLPEDPAERLRARSDLYHAVTERFSNDQWLRENLLGKVPDKSPDAFSSRVSGTLVQLRSAQSLTASAMLAHSQLWKPTAAAAQAPQDEQKEITECIVEIALFHSDDIDDWYEEFERLCQQPFEGSLSEHLAKALMESGGPQVRYDLTLSFRSQPNFLTNFTFNLKEELLRCYVTVDTLSPKAMVYFNFERIRREMGFPVTWQRGYSGPLTSQGPTMVLKSTQTKGVETEYEIMIVSIRPSE